MANDGWKNKAARRWNSVERTRIARRFRHHVRTDWNPKGRIHRDFCAACLDEGEQTWVTEGHHIDYDRPFVVVWLCFRHHRQVDHGSLRIKQRWIHDYTSLVPVRKKLWADAPF